MRSAFAPFTRSLPSLQLTVTATEDELSVHPFELVTKTLYDPCDLTEYLFAVAPAMVVEPLSH